MLHKMVVFDKTNNYITQIRYKIFDLPHELSFY